MRSLTIQILPNRTPDVLRLVAEHGGGGARVAEARSAAGESVSIVTVELDNHEVGTFVEAVAEAVEEARFSFAPAGVVAIETPLAEVRDRVKAVSQRSTLELVLGALQSIGSWRGLIYYAVFSGVVAAYALMFNITYLLVAAMLISPMGGPAMVAVIALSIGEASMFRRGAARFWAAIALLSISAAAVAAAYGLDFSTNTMELVGSLSGWVVLVAVVGGAAGALAQVQAERDSLVTATATGFLVAVSLSPPAAMLGLGAVIARWDYVGQMALLLILTFSGILVGGWLTLLSFGVKPTTTAGSRGAGRVRAALATIVVGTLVALTVWQQIAGPSLRKADLSRDAVKIAREVISATPELRLLQADAAFTRPDVPGLNGESLLLQLWVTHGRDASARPADAVVEEMRERIDEGIREELRDVIPFVEVTAVATGVPR